VKQDESVAVSETLALLYFRSATHEDGEHGHAVQVAVCRRYVADHGWALDSEHQDIGVPSAGYTALVTRLRALRAQGQPVVVVIATLDRLGRTAQRMDRLFNLQMFGAVVHAAAQRREFSMHHADDAVSATIRAIAERYVAGPELAQPTAGKAYSG